MNKIKIFDFNNNQVRTTIIDGEPYFVGKDVASVLGYSNPRDALAKHVDDEDKGVAKCDTLGGSQEMVVINESGLYSLVLSSKLETAKIFKRWVTSEVLPAIRKTGTYNLPQTFSQALRALAESAEENERLALENVAVKQINSELKPKADYYDEILKNKGTVTTTAIAKDYGLSGVALNRMLHELGVQYKQSDQWFLYQEFADKGYTHSETIEITKSDGHKGITMHTKWTQKGRMFLYETLKASGVVPVIEK